LAQRCNARTPSDLIVAVRATFDAIVKAKLDVAELSSAGRRLAIALPGNMGDAITVLVKHDDPEVHAPVVVTILPPDADQV
jgi:hypothetical protein